MRDNNRGYHRRHQTNAQSAYHTNNNTSTMNKQYITSRYNNIDDDNESYPSMGKDIVTCNKKRNMPPRGRGQIEYSRDRGIYDKQSSKRGISRNDYKNYEKNSYQREPSGIIGDKKSYHREPSGMRISQLMNEERQPQNNNNRDDYPPYNGTRDEYRDSAPLDNVLKEELNDDSWEISSRITSISNARSSSPHLEGIPKSIPTKIRTTKTKGVDCNASRMTGWTGHTGVTPLVNNLDISTKKKKKQQYEQNLRERGVENDREDQYRQEEEDKVLRTRSTTNNKPPRPSVARSPSPILPTLTKTRDGGQNYRKESFNGGGSSNNTSSSSIKKMLTNVSSITGWSPDKQQTKLAKDEQEQQDVGIDPARGSFDLVIIPKEKRRQKKQVATKKQLTAEEAASVASETAHHHKPQQVMKNLTYWSSLSVKAAMAVISSDTKNGSDEEKMAQIAANAVLEAGREYDSSVNTTNTKNRKKEEIKVDLKDVATKVSVAILESGGDHTVATAVAVVIMNEKALSLKDQGSNSSVSTEVAVNTSDGVQGSTENINEALSSSITTKDTTTASASIFSRNRWNNRKSKSATDDSIRAAAARGVKKAGQGRNYSDWQLQVDRRNSELGGGFDRQSVTASMASKRRELEAKEAEIISRNQALEAAALLNQQKEVEIQQRLQELNTTTQKQQQLKDQEDEIKLKNEQLEAAARMNEQMEIEIKQRMLALDEATNALLVRAENVQNEINTRVTAPNNGQQQQVAVYSLGRRVDEGQEFVEGGYQQRQQQQQQQQYEYDPMHDNGYGQSRGNVYDPHNSNGFHQQQPREDQPREGTKADGEISVYTNQADYVQQSRFDLIQQEDHQEQKQRHERSQSDPSRLQEQTDKGILEQISDKLYSIIDDANLCDTSCADPSTLRPGENSVTQRRPSYHNMDPASSFGSSLPMNKPTISGLTTQEDQHRTWSNWFGKSNNMPKSQQESSHLPPVHAAVNQALNQPHKMQQTNPSQQLPEYKSPSEMVDLNQALAQAMNQRNHKSNVQPTDEALNEALKQAMGQAHGFEFQPISHNIQQESSMLSSTSKVGGLSTKLKSRFKKQKNTTTAQPPQEGSNKKRFFSLARRKTAK